MNATTQDFKAAHGPFEGPRADSDIVKAVRDMDISRRMSDLEEIAAEKETSAAQSQHKLEDMSVEGAFSAIKKLGMGVSIVSAALGPRSQKMMRMLGGIGQAFMSLGESWTKSVNRERTESALASSTHAGQTAREQLKALQAGQGAFKPGGPGAGGGFG
jgi:hypothetical protein